MHIYELHKNGVTVHPVVEMFGISESRAQAIFWATKGQQI
jgi:hypothetical protein